LRLRWGVIPAAAFVFAGIGCAPKSRIASDPFRRSNPPASIPDDPRYDGASTFERANESARRRDVSSDVATAPVGRPRLASVQTDVPYSSTGRNSSDPNDPFLNAGSGPPAVRMDRTDPNVFSSGEQGQSRFEVYENVRQRLDRAGAHNFQFQRDPATNDTIFSCELPYPDTPSLIRVFEAKSPDELKAMLAVAEQVEKWTAGRR